MDSQTASDLPFDHYTMKHRSVAWISQNVFDNFVYTVRHGLIKGMKRRGGLGWLPESLTGSSRTMEQSFWMSQNLKNLVMYDIGAFHGLLTLFFARECRQVISYEPNTRNHARLIENIHLNGLKNVLVRQVGLGSKSGVVTMIMSRLMPGGASTERNTVAGLLNSRVPVLSEQISITTLDDDIHKASLPRPDFVKIDIEGGELPALVGARNTLLAYHPLLFLEMHGETMSLKIENAAAIVSCLNEFGYGEILHIESGTRINADNSFCAAEGHLYCQ